MNREELEAQALINICGCYHYALCDTIKDTTDAELLQVIENPMTMHMQNNDTLEEFANCPYYVLKTRKEVTA